VLAAGAIADDAHHSSEPTAPATSAPRTDSAPPTAVGGMHGHMKRMHDQLAQIRATSDAKERYRLMEEHMKTMDETMPMMQQMMKRMQMMGPDKAHSACK
jgi:hypothetical protein